MKLYPSIILDNMVGHIIKPLEPDLDFICENDTHVLIKYMNMFVFWLRPCIFSIAYLTDTTLDITWWCIIIMQSRCKFGTGIETMWIDELVCLLCPGPILTDFQLKVSCLIWFRGFNLLAICGSWNQTKLEKRQFWFSFCGQVLLNLFTSFLQNIKDNFRSCYTARTNIYDKTVSQNPDIS